MENMPFVDQRRKRKVARDFLLTDIEKAEILAFSDVGLNRTEIARKIGRSRNVVANFLRAPDEYGIKKSGGRPTKLGKREKKITMIASNSMANLDEIRSNHCQIVSKTTVWRALKANPYIRMDFARAHMSWTSEWIEVFFPTRNFGGGSLMSWNTVIIDWSSRSPNLDPMENLWRILARQVYAHNRQSSSIEKTGEDSFRRVEQN
uniref:HTH_Tnp_Tc3_1 domain-containing protein n=1 Tax=Heterorhabditis bacteriophora TaxID=37862 RepID=A0A1I7X3D8_HETBA